MIEPRPSPIWTGTVASSTGPGLVRLTERAIREECRTSRATSGRRTRRRRPDAIAFGLGAAYVSLVEGSGGGAGLSVEALRDRAPVEDRKVVCREELETLSSKADIDAAARRRRATPRISATASSCSLGYMTGPVKKARSYLVLQHRARTRPKERRCWI